MAGQYAGSCHSDASVRSGSGDVVHQQQKASDLLWMAFYDSDQVKIDTFCGVFGVSRSAAAIRLEQLGYLNRKRIMNIVIHWRCGHEQEYQSIGTICGNAD